MNWKLIALALGASASLAHGQVFSTTFDDDTGWTLSGSYSACSFEVDASSGSMTGGPFRSAPSSLNAQNWSCDDFYNETAAVSPVIDLTGTTAPSLSFWCNQRTWNEASRHVIISNDGFATEALDYELTYEECPDWEVWHQHTVELDEAWGAVEVRFLFTIGGVLFSGDNQWYIDDMIVEEGCLVPATYCPTSTNSTGAGARIGFTGTSSMAADDLRLSTTGCPTNKPAIYFMGPNQIQVPFGDGWRCVGGAIKRFNVISTGSSGTPTQNVDFDTSAGTFITEGSTWNFQCWFRDPPGPGGTGYNLSDALSVTFCP